MQKNCQSRFSIAIIKPLTILSRSKHGSLFCSKEYGTWINPTFVWLFWKWWRRVYIKSLQTYVPALKETFEGIPAACIESAILRTGKVEKYAQLPF